MKVSGIKKIKFSNLNIDLIMIMLLILSCIISGIIFEGLFWISYLVLFYRNREKISNNRFNGILYLVICCYLVLMLIQLVNLYPKVSWRVVGITKCYCGLAMILLISKVVSKINTYKLIIYLLTLFNIVLIIQQISSIDLTKILGLPGLNSCLCLNLIFLPHLILVYKNESFFANFVYVVTALSFLLLCDSGMYRYGILLIVFLIFAKSFFKISINDKKKKNIYCIVVIMLMFLCISIIFFEDFRKIYYYFLGKIDISRVEILQYGIKHREGISIFEKFFGRGEILYTVAYGRLIEAHNFFVEMLTMYGIVGVGVLILETLVLLLGMSQKIMSNKYSFAICLSIIFAYLAFLVHPFYSTSFFVKIIFIIINVNTYYLNSNEEKKSCSK